MALMDSVAFIFKKTHFLQVGLDTHHTNFEYHHMI